jgi:hypothetical protein
VGSGGGATLSADTARPVVRSQRIAHLGEVRNKIDVIRFERPAGAVPKPIVLFANNTPVTIALPGPSEHQILNTIDR